MLSSPFAFLNKGGANGGSDLASPAGVKADDKSPSTASPSSTNVRDEVSPASMVSPASVPKDSPVPGNAEGPPFQRTLSGAELDDCLKSLVARSPPMFEGTSIIPPREQDPVSADSTTRTLEQPLAGPSKQFASSVSNAPVKAALAAAPQVPVPRTLSGDDLADYYKQQLQVPRTLTGEDLSDYLRSLQVAAAPKIVCPPPPDEAFCAVRKTSSSDASAPTPSNKVCLATFPGAKAGSGPIEAAARSPRGSLVASAVTSTETIVSSPPPPPTKPAPSMEQNALPPPPAAPAISPDAKVVNIMEVLPESEIGSPERPTRGSWGHNIGKCKPCAFLYTKGCKNGLDCEFCHLCGRGEKKRRQREKWHQQREQQQMQAQAAAMASMMPYPGPPPAGVLWP